MSPDGDHINTVNDFVFLLSVITNSTWCVELSGEKVKARINFVIVRTALAYSLLGVFHPKGILRGKRLRDLDKRVISAIEGNLPDRRCHSTFFKK